MAMEFAVEKKAHTFSDWINIVREEKQWTVEPDSLEHVMLRWPLLVAHVICESLGYATPSCAARIVADAAAKRDNWCEWIACCYGHDPREALRQAVKTRRWHRGYMADQETAKALVLNALMAGKEPALASWF
jgi:hypothetical protein